MWREDFLVQGTLCAKSTVLENSTAIFLGQRKQKGVGPRGLGKQTAVYLEQRVIIVYLKEGNGGISFKFGNVSSSMAEGVN